MKSGWICIITAIVVIIILVVLGIWLFASTGFAQGFTRGKSADPPTIPDPPQEYELLSKPETDTHTEGFIPLPGPVAAPAIAVAPVPVADAARWFGNIVSNCETNLCMEQQARCCEPSPMERLATLESSDILHRMPRCVTPFNVDVSDPATYAYALNPARVILKDRQWEQADVFRGDIPITDSCVPIVSKSRFGKSSLRMDGAFTDMIVGSYGKCDHQRRPHVSACEEVREPELDCGVYLS